MKLCFTYRSGSPLPLHVLMMRLCGPLTVFGGTDGSVNLKEAFSSEAPARPVIGIPSVRDLRRLDPLATMLRSRTAL